MIDIDYFEEKKNIFSKVEISLNYDLWTITDT